MSRNKKKRAGVSPRRWRVVFLSCLVMALLALVLVLPGAIGIAAGTPPSKVPGSPSGLLKASVNPEHGLGCKLTPPGDYPKAVVPQVASVATAVDLCPPNMPIGDQGWYKSCVGWAVGYYYKTFSESLEHTTWPIDWQHGQYIFSPDFIWNQINGGVNQGVTISAALDLLQNKGDVDIGETWGWDYKTLPTPAEKQAALPYRIPSGWGHFWMHSGQGPYSTSNNITPIKACLSGGNMLVMAIPIYSDFPEYTTHPASKYYDYDNSSGFHGWHAVCITGYDDNIHPSGSNADHRGGFRMVNSWGSGWNVVDGKGGFLYLSYDFVKRYVPEAWSMGDLSPDTPSVTSLSRTSGEPGDSVTISGKNFGTNRRDAKVMFNGLNWKEEATPTSWTNSSITVTVPTGAITGPLTVYDWDGVPANSINFTVTFWLSAIKPNTGFNNRVVSCSLEGGGFKSGAAVSSVRLQTQAYHPTPIYATDVQFVSDTKITCKFDLTGAEKDKYDVFVTKTNGHEAWMWEVFTVYKCGTGAGAATVALVGMLGLMATAGSRRFRSRLKAMLKYRR
jgi:hypothetical protein